MGGLPIEAITTRDCLAVLRAIEQRGSNETAKRTLGVISLVMDYAVALGHCLHNPAHALKRHAPIKLITSHFPCISWGELPELLGAMRTNAIHADASTLPAMWRLALTFVRTSELIATQWGSSRTSGTSQPPAIGPAPCSTRAPVLGGLPDRLDPGTAGPTASRGAAAGGEPEPVGED